MRENKKKQSENLKPVDEALVAAVRAKFAVGLTTAARTLRRRSELVARLHGFTVASVAPLIQLGRSHEGLRLTTLAELIDADPVSVSRIMKNLESGGLVLRDADPDDGRAQILRLSEKGRKLVEAAEVSLVEYRRQIFNGISTSDMEVALRVFGAMEENAPSVNLDFLTSLTG
jgi:MarR family transcriptional regulator, transcriptional regulator for hemolysin